jgi:hypothetical protein
MSLQGRSVEKSRAHSLLEQHDSSTKLKAEIRGIANKLRCHAKMGW